MPHYCVTVAIRYKESTCSLALCAHLQLLLGTPPNRASFESVIIVITIIRSLPSFLVLHTVGRVTLYIFAACTFQSSFSQHCQFPLIAGLSLGSDFMPCDSAEGPTQTSLFKCNWRNLWETVSLGFFLPCGFLPLQLHLRGKVPP